MTHDPFTLVAAVLLGTVATARATRLVTSDHWPPILWLRMRWLTWCANGSERREAWADLFTCPACQSPYLAAGNLALAWYSGLATWWWLLNIWAAVSYAAFAIVVRDEPPAE